MRAINSKVTKIDSSYFEKIVMRSFKKKFKKKIGVRKINSIMKDFFINDIGGELAKGKSFKWNSLEFSVETTHVTDNKRFMTLLDKGLMISNGRVVKANVNQDTFGFINKIILKVKDRDDVYFTPHKNLKKAVIEGIISGKLVTRN